VSTSPVKSSEFIVHVQNLVGHLLFFLHRTRSTILQERYGFGLIINREVGHLVISHEGGVEGFNTQMTYYPEDKLVIIVLANLNGPAHGEIARNLAKVAHGDRVVLISERKEVTLDPQVLATYTGIYHLASVSRDLAVSSSR
jgi:hypothetical protein